MVKRYIKVSEAVDCGGPCRSKIYADAKVGKLTFTKFGRSTRIELNEWSRYLDAVSFEVGAPAAREAA